MTAQQWIEQFAAEVGIDAPDEEQFGELLELAAVAAHASERIAAPVACFIAGVSGRSVRDLKGIAEGVGAQDSSAP